MSTTTSGTSPCPPSTTTGMCIPECTGRVDITPTSPAFQIVQALTPGTIVENARLLITTPFDGRGLALSFGTSTSPQLIMAPSDTNLAAAAGTEFIIPQAFIVPVMDNLVLNLVLGGSTVGAATLLYDVRPQ